MKGKIQQDQVKKKASHLPPPPLLDAPLWGQDTVAIFQQKMNKVDAKLSEFKTRKKKAPLLPEPLPRQVAPKLI